MAPAVTSPRRRGSSLLEVLVASSLLTAVLASTTMAVAQGARQVGHTRHVHEAEAIAAAQVEQLLVLAADGPLRDGSRRFAADGREDGAGPYTVSWKVREGVPIPGGARLDVVVSWDEGMRRQLEMRTYLALRPPPDPSRPERR